MIFVDTSAFYALADRDDPHHGAARVRLRSLLEADEGLLTHNYVLVESMALLQSRLGREAALRLAHDSRAIDVEWIDAAAHQEAVRALARQRRRVSFVDQVSFVVMRRRAVEVAFAFDPDFEREGFRLA
jgi:predicted nucleic acid-binding protein